MASRRGCGEAGRGKFVALRNGQVTLNTHHADMLGVVSNKAMIEGSAPQDQRRHVTIAYVGRVPVRVRGEVTCGDLITASGRNDGTGMRATGLHLPTVGRVVTLGTAPKSLDENWHVEIIIPGRRATSRVACTAGSTLNVRQRSLWVAVRSACKHELVMFYQQQNPFGEGGIMNRVMESIHLSDRQRMVDSVNLGSMLLIGETCAGSLECPIMLRRYLDTCPIVPPERASSSALDGLGNRWHASTADMDEGRLDIFFARQCLSRHYPDLLSPPSLVVNVAASGVAVKKRDTSCSARALGLED